jgi:serine/threonine protein kinase
MAPEVLNEAEYNFKADIWSFGVLLYQLCTLKLPFADID